MKLIEQIKRGKFSGGDLSFGEGWNERIWKQKVVEGAKHAVYCDVTNVMKWILATYTEGTGVTIPELCPIAKLPFGSMFFEFTNPGGVTIGTLSGEVENKPDLIFFIFASSEAGVKPIGAAILAVNPDDFSGAGLQFSPTNTIKARPNYKRILEAMRSDIAPTLAAISFFHCKNVKIVPAKRNAKLEKSFEKKHGFTPSVMHTIEIHKFMKRTEVSREESDSTREIRSHIVRGHFKKFEGEKKLFGRIEGMFFWEPHVRGGDTAKPNDYRVWGPERTHAKDCIVQP